MQKKKWPNGLEFGNQEIRKGLNIQHRTSNVEQGGADCQLPMADELRELERFRRWELLLCGLVTAAWAVALVVMFFL